MPAPLRPLDDPQAAVDPVPMYGIDYKRDPYPMYTRLRTRGPIHRMRFPSGVLAWLVTGYKAACAMLSDERLGKNHARGNDAWRERAAIMPEPQHSQLQVHLLHQDPPRHTVMRRLVADAFTPRRAEQLRPRVRALADALVDALPEHATQERPVDLLATFAAVMPFQVLAEAIGLPADLAAAFHHEWGQVVAPVGPTDPGRARYESLLSELQAYIARVVDRSRTAAEPTVLASLVAAHEDGELSRAELDSTIVQLLVAGQEPVTNQLCTALLALFTHPAELAALRQRLAASSGSGSTGRQEVWTARRIQVSMSVPSQP